MFADRVFETTATTGTGALSLAGAQTGYRGFADAFNNGDVVAYHCRNADGTIWEAGFGTLDTSAGTITRNLLDSSTGALINWAAGSKSVYCAPSGEVLAALVRGAKATTRPGWLQAGGLYVNDSASPWLLKAYDGTDEITLGEIDPTANDFEPYAGGGKVLPLAGGALSGALNLAKAGDVASAATTNIWASDGNLVHVTGTTTITAFGTAAQAGARRTVVFDGVLTLTNGANLILPGGANITTAAGDVAEVVAETATQARVVSFSPADGEAVVAAVSGWQLIQTQTVGAAVASVDFETLAYGTYKAFRVVFAGVQPATDAVSFQARIHEEGVGWMAGSADYQYSYRAQDSTTDTLANSAGTSVIAISNPVGNASHEGVAGEITFFNFDISALRKTAIFQAVATKQDSSMRGTVGVGCGLGEPHIADGIRLQFSSGNVAAGTFHLYGLRGA